MKLVDYKSILTYHHGNVRELLMKRDFDLARKILLIVEADDNAVGDVLINLSIDGYSKKQISYHVALLHEAKFLEASSVFTMEEGEIWQPLALT